MFAQTYDRRPGGTDAAVRRREDDVCNPSDMALDLERLTDDFIVSSPSESCVYVCVFFACLVVVKTVPFVVIATYHDVQRNSCKETQQGSW